MSNMQPISKLNPEPSRRILVLDPAYPENHEMRMRIIDSEFVKHMDSVTHFAELSNLEPVKEQTIYQKHGYVDRDDYMYYLSEEYNVDIDIVYDMAAILGPDEEFDGLVTNLEDGEGYW